MLPLAEKSVDTPAKLRKHFREAYSCLTREAKLYFGPFDQASFSFSRKTLVSRKNDVMLCWINDGETSVGAVKVLQQNN